MRIKSEELLKRLLPSDVVWSVAKTTCLATELFPEEAVVVAGAAEKRRNEFAAGRQAAHQALCRLNGYRGPVPQALDRTPIWPHGVVGSISHDDGLAVAAVAFRSRVWSLGIDIEMIGRFDFEVEHIICTPKEKTTLLQMRDAFDRRQLLAMVFCIKEAVYKAQYPMTNSWLGFEDLEVDVPEFESSSFMVTLRRTVGRFSAGHTFEVSCLADELRCFAALVLRAEH